MISQTELRLSRYQPRTAMAPHQHDEASMGIVVSGHFMERIGSDERRYSRGTVSFCPPATTHSQIFGAVGVRQIIFKPADSWLDYLADCKTGLDNAPHTRSATFRHLGDKLLGEIGRDDRFSPVVCEGIMLEIIAEFGRDRTAAPAAGNPPPWLRAAREFVRENACAPLTMVQIAREAGRHEIHLAREFRRFFGCSVGTYMRRLRIERAVHLLIQPRVSISEIALGCGFASHSHLCREFKGHVGLTPSQYRLARGR